MTIHLSNRFARVLRLTGVGSGTEILDDIEVRSGETRIYDRVTIENEDSANSDARIVVRRPNESLTVAYFANLTAATPVTYDDTIVVTRDDETLAVNFTDVTANDNLIVTVFGYSVFGKYGVEN